MSTVSTNNWDTAFGIRFKAANAAIVERGSSPANFQGTHTVSGATFDVKADFGAWHMSGGSGSLLEMTLPLANGTISGGGQTDSAFAGEATIQVGLGFIPQPGGSTRHLKLDTTREAAVLDLNLTAGPDSAKDSIEGGLQDWLVAHLDEFNHVFAAVDLNTQADTGEFAWLQPTHLGYAIYTEGITSTDDYLFGVLAMTDHRTGQRRSPELEPAIIPDGADAGFLIAAPLALEKLFRPHVEVLFENAKSDDFDTRDDGMTLYNVKELGLPDFTLAGGKKITDAAINADGFNLSIGTGAVIIEFTGLTFTYETGYTVTVNYGSVNAMATDEDGHLQLNPTGVPTVSMSISESSGEKWKDIWQGLGIGIATAVVGAVLGGLAEAGLAARQAAQAAIEAGIDASVDGTVEIELQAMSKAIGRVDEVAADVSALKSAVAALKNPEAAQGFAGFFRANAFKLLGAAIGAAVGGGLASIPVILDGYADEDRDRMPTLDDFAAKAIGNTTWAGSSGYSLTSARLRGALQLGLHKDA